MQPLEPEKQMKQNEHEKDTTNPTSSPKKIDKVLESPNSATITNIYSVPNETEKALLCATPTDFTKLSSSIVSPLERQGEKRKCHVLQPVKKSLIPNPYSLKL